MRLVEKDLYCLRWLCEMNFGSVDQLWRAVWRRDESRSAKYAEERLRFLEKDGYIKRELMPGTKQRFFRCTKKGHDVLSQVRGDVVPPIRKINFGQFDHDNFLIELRLEFEKTGAIKSFQSDRVLKAELFSGKNSRERSRYEDYHMVPDAKMLAREGDVIWLEYDRTKKSYDRFKEKAYRLDDRLRAPHHRLIWIVEDQGIFEMVKDLVSTFRDDQVIVITREQFLKAGAAAVLEDLSERKKVAERKRAEQENSALRLKKKAEEEQFKKELEQISRELETAELTLMRLTEEQAALEKKFFRKRELEAEVFFQMRELTAVIDKKSAIKKNLSRKLMFTSLMID